MVDAIMEVRKCLERSVRYMRKVLKSVGILVMALGIFFRMSLMSFAAFLYRYANYKGYDTIQVGDFSELQNIDKVTPYAKGAVNWAVGAGLIIESRSDSCRSYKFFLGVYLEKWNLYLLIGISPPFS